MDCLRLLEKAVNRAGSQAAVAAELGYSPATISMLLKGKYNGNVDAVKKKVLSAYGEEAMQKEKKIPEGCWEDPQGRYIHVDSIKEIDKTRDELVKRLVEQAKATSAVLAEFKHLAFGEIEGFVQLSAMEYGVELGGVKGNITLMSFDGKYKVVRAIGEFFVFDERLKIAKKLIDACFNEWTNESRPELKTMVNDAFQVDKQGNVNAQRVLSLRKYAIDDERWKKAMTAISESLTVASSRAYVRLYERVDDTKKWKQIPLDIAGV